MNAGFAVLAATGGGHSVSVRAVKPPFVNRQSVNRQSVNQQFSATSTADRMAK